MLTIMPLDEVREIASSLEDYHKVFYCFFEMSSVYYSEEGGPVNTAAIKFNPGYKPDLIFNREFWKELNHRERLFVVCHECLHVILQHGERAGKEVEGSTPRLVNVAQDITINEMIVDLFGFNRDDVRDWKKFCWIDTCFKHHQLVKRNETFTYYLKLLIAEKSDDLPSLVDEHGAGTSQAGSDSDPSNSSASKKQAEEIAEKLAEELTAEELETLIGALTDDPTAGSLAGMLEEVVGKKQKRPKINFVKLIRHLKRSRIKEQEADSESFVCEDRRFADVIKKSNVSIPGKHPVSKPARDRLLTALFMDVSGSCIGYLPTFDKVFVAFDHERSIFEIKTFAFDVHVREITPGQQVAMGGGTKFNIIETKLQELKAEFGKYPDCVIVITDGEGTEVIPEIPSRWIWLLTPNPTYSMIPNNSKKLLISDVIF